MKHSLDVCDFSRGRICTLTLMAFVFLRAYSAAKMILHNIVSFFLVLRFYDVKIFTEQFEM